MSQEEQTSYDEIDRLLEMKEEELRELGAMRVRALEKTNEELKDQIDRLSDLLMAKDEELEDLKQHLLHKTNNREDYESRFYRLNELLQSKDIEISELKTNINTYHADLWKKIKKVQELEQNIVSLFQIIYLTI